MTSLFTTILDMSIIASYVAIAVIVIRVFLKKVPKIFSFILWLPVLIRLVMPFSFNSRISIFGIIKPEAQNSTGIVKFAQNNIGLIQNPIVDVGANELNNSAATTVSSATSATSVASVNHIPSIMEIASYIWVIGIVVLLIYSIFSYIKVLKNVKTATLIEGNVFETDRIASPFVCGFIKPKIYIPVGLNGNELSYILKHEQTHIRRLDYIAKPFAFLALIIHWFNPLMWLSFVLMSKDMEMSCDESVIKQMGNNIKGSYSNSLLSLSVKRGGLIMGSPLAFGESNIKSRIKNILNYKKPAFWVGAIVIIVTVVLVVSFTANPINRKKPAELPTFVTAPTATQLLNTNIEYNIDALIANKTSYVGNNSKVVALIDALPLPEGIVRDKVELKTDRAPYAMIINLITEESTDVFIKKGMISNEICANTILLFSLIDNVDTIEYSVSDRNGSVSSLLTYSREVIEGYMNGDVRPYAKNKERLEELVEKIRAFDYSKTIENLRAKMIKDAQVEKEIEQYLRTIMSSPKESSNPYDYLATHEKEQDSILKMGDEAYLYLQKQLEISNSKGTSKGLRYQILTRLLKEFSSRGLVSDEIMNWISK